MAESRIIMQIVFLAIMVVMVFMLSLSGAYQFSVGGRDGWVLHPSEDYNHWAGRNRFQVNDTILFRYPKGKDSVLEVTSDDYITCNPNNPLKTLTDGESLFKFDRSGPFFFVSGVVDSCKNGQKLIIVVMAVRPDAPPTVPTPPPPSPSAASPSPVVTPPVSPRPQPPQSGVPPKADTPTLGPTGNTTDEGVKAPAPVPAPNSAIMLLGFGSSGGVLVWCVCLGASLVMGSNFARF